MVGLLQSYSHWSGRNNDCTFLLRRLGISMEDLLLTEEYEGKVEKIMISIIRVDIV